MAEWHTPASAADEWKDGPRGVALEALLDAAREQCLAFAPALPEATPVDIPASWRLAHLLQAKALYNAQQGPSTEDMYGGGEAAGVRVYEMGATIRRLLRPLSGFPAVG